MSEPGALEEAGLLLLLREPRSHFVPLSPCSSTQLPGLLEPWLLELAVLYLKTIQYLSVPAISFPPLLGQMAAFSQQPHSSELQLLKKKKELQFLPFIPSPTVLPCY